MCTGNLLYFTLTPRVLTCPIGAELHAKPILVRHSHSAYSPLLPKKHRLIHTPPSPKKTATIPPSLAPFIPKSSTDIEDWYDWVEEYEEDFFSGKMGRGEVEMFSRAHKKIRRLVVDIIGLMRLEVGCGG